MKKILLLFIFVLFSANLSAQNTKKSLLESNRNSYYAYIYRLTDAQAEFACKNQYNKIEIKNLGQPIDSFIAKQDIQAQNTDNQRVNLRYNRYQTVEEISQNEYTKKLPLGNYLRVFTQENQVIMVYMPVSNIVVDLVLNDRDLKIAVTDTLNGIINNAEVFVENKKISFDKKTQSYQDPKSRKKGFVRVKYQNINYYYSLQKTYATPSFGRYLYFYTLQLPWRYIKKPFRYIKKVTKMIFNEGFRDDVKYEKKYQKRYKEDDKQDLDNYKKERRYVAFSKPMYKPKDTLKLKFMSVLHNNKYDESPYFVYLNGQFGTNRQSKTIFLDTISPYQKGFYEYKLFLHDSLKLIEGTYDGYILHFYNQKRHKEYLKEAIDYKNKDNDSDDDFQFDEQNEKGFFRERFIYKDYELNEITYKARLEHTEHYPALENRIYLSAKDANDLPIADAKAEIIITKQNINNFPNKTVFIPNELWRTNKTLEPIGETALVLPDSIFKGFDMSYKVKVIFTNAENKRVEQDFAATRVSKRFPVKIELVSGLGVLGKDSLKISYKIPASANTPVRVSAKNAFGVQKIKILDLKLPAKIPFDKNLDYEIENFDKEIESYGNNRDKFSLITERNQDSVKIAFKNPLLLPVWYEIFEDQKSIKKGFFMTDSYVFEDKNRTEKNYFVSCNYPNANTKNGAMIKEEYTVELNKNELKIIVKQPTKVFPNQKAQIDILVLDHNDKPVADVDITAYAINNQFKDKKTPQMPYLGKKYASRKGKRGFKLDKNNTQHKENLTHTDWEKRIDSLEYYKFLYPKNGVYQASFVAQDSITQFSAYVVKNGKIQPVFYIKVDGYPVFWSIIHSPTYSFHITEGKHQVEIRTDSSSVIFNDVIFEKYKNNILSIGITNQKFQKNQKITVTNAKNTLLTQERAFLSNYFIKMENNYYTKPFSYIKQNNKVFPIANQRNSYNYNNNTWIGSFMPNNYALFASPLEKYAHNFVFESNYSYLFNSNLIKMRSLNLDNEQFNAYYPTINIFRDEKTKTVKFEHSLMSEKRILKDMETYLENEKFNAYYRNDYFYDYGRCQVNWNMQTDLKKRIQSILILEMDKNLVKKVAIHRLKDTILNNFDNKKYKMLFLFDKNEFFSTEISPKANGTNYYFFEKLLLQKDDSIMKRVRKQIYFADASRDLLQIKRFLNGDFKNYSNGGFKISFDAKIPKNAIKGKIVDKRGEGIPGANIVCNNNQQIATVTDDNGEFILENVACDILMISAVGFVDTQISIGTNNIINIRMREDDELETVTVSAYGVQEKRSAISASTDRAMQGRLAEVQVNSGQPGSALNVRVRGVSSITSGNQPLYIVDGVQLTLEQFKALNPDNIESMEVLKDAASAAVYGAQGTNGAVIVTTNKTKKPKNLAQNTENQLIPDLGESRLRNSFRDDAYWKPRLRTDEQGKASFSVTFPDDLTSWHTVVLAASSSLQTGTQIGNIKAFKPLSASIVLPRFVVMEDSVQVLGKTMNYTNDTLAIETHFEVGKTVFPTKNQKLANGNVEKQWLNVSNDNILKGIEKDSLEVKYVMFQKEYFDGETRKIPVFAKGTQETKGFFANIYKDSLITWKFDKEKGKVKFHAEANLIKVVLDELKHLHEYGYLCNEQAASKLKAYLYHKIIAKKLGKPFLYERDVLSLIKRLQDNKNEKQLWGWWGTSTAFGTQMWVSSHILSVLMLAKTEGYVVNINEELLKNDFMLSLSQEKGLYRCLELLETLDKIGAKVDYKLFLEEIEKKNLQNKISNKNLTIKLEKERKQPKSQNLQNQQNSIKNTSIVIETYAEILSFQDYLSLQILKQKNSLSYNVDTLFKVKRETMFGNIYWSDAYESSYYENSNDITLNEVQTSLLAIKLLKNTKKYENEQQLCINYLMEKRQNQGYWLNTYESIQIIDVLADYIQFSDDKKIIKNPEIILSGSINKTIDTFPYSAEFLPENSLSIQRKHNIKSPLYITAYQTYQNTNPQKEEKYYKISSEFIEKIDKNSNINKAKTITKNDSQNNTQKTTLEAGKPVILRVEIEISKAAKYVLVEIPIPAGCGYENEAQEIRNNPNREYQRNKVNIFVENLGAGKQVYEIALLPRYNGVFTLNPTRVELMYFPTFFGRNTNQKVVIK